MSSSKTESPPRKLVSLRHISQIKPLTSSKVREVAMVGGWPVVVGKGKFTVDQVILYFEIGSFLPFDDDRFKPHRSSQVSAELHGKKGWAVQTVTIGGQVSQGMVLRPDTLWEVGYAKARVEAGLDQDDVDFETKVQAEMMKIDFTDKFKVKKWTTFYRLDGGRDLGKPPCFLPDAKLTPVQNLPDLWKTHGDTEFEITELLDGMPITVYQVRYDDWRYSTLPGILIGDTTGLFDRRSATGISIGDHDYEETEDSSSWTALRSQGIIDALRSYQPAEDVVLAGVLCGVGIAGNPHEISGRRFYVHSISNPAMNQFTLLYDVRWMVRLKSTFETVPKFSQRIRLTAFAQNIDELLRKVAGGGFVSNPRRKGPKRKGLVFRALDGSLSFKVISNEWLLDETKKLQELGEDARRRPGPNDCAF